MNSMNGEIDIEYWRKYHIIWDCFVRSWFDNCKGNQVCKKYRNIADKYRSHAENLEFSELPEPYYGEPSAGVDAVFLNLNPGMLSGESNDKRAKNKRDEKLELQKFYTHIDKSEGWLIQKFRDDCNGSYMRYVKDYSPLKPEFKKNYGKNDEVCGVKWWLGKGTLEDRVEGDAARILWVNRIYGKGDNRIYANDIKPSRVFALEVCPFHSKKWNFTCKSRCGS